LKKKNQFEVTSRNIASLQEAIITSTRYESTISNGRKDFLQNNMVKRVNYVGKTYKPKGKQRFPSKPHNNRSYQTKAKALIRLKILRRTSILVKISHVTSEKERASKCHKYNWQPMNKPNIIKFDDEEEELELVNMISIASASSNTRKLLTIQGIVSGWKMVIGFDSGATASVIS